MKCENCGKPLDPAERNCPACGAEVQKRAQMHEPTSALTVVETEGGEEIEIIHPPEGVPEGKAVLIIKKGPDTGARFILEKDCTTLGRHPESDIFLDDITVSRRHAEIRKAGEGFVIVDMGSLNGTYVNRERIESFGLGNGDEIQVGKFRMLFFQGR